MAKMIPLAVWIIDWSFNNQQRSIRFWQGLIIGLLIIGIIFGILAYYMSMLFGFVEVLIAPALIWSIRSYRAVNKDNVGLLNGANRTLMGARSQAKAEHRMRKEIESERQKGE